MDDSLTLNRDYPLQPITIGVITHKGRFDNLREFLDQLAVPILMYEQWSHQQTELIIVNNSGNEFSSALQNAIRPSIIFTNCTVRVIDSPQNNIATGRNIILDNHSFKYLAFIDDDEIPTKNWLIELAKVMFTHNCAVVTGPVHPSYPGNASKWLRSLDLHNTSGRKDGEDLRFTGTGNVLMNSHKLYENRFNESYGRSGGSDTEFFLRVTDSCERIIWAEKASLLETIPSDRASLRYFLRRCISQGRNFRRILTERNEISSQFFFTVRAVLVILLSLFVAVVLMLFRSQRAGKWLKRAFANIGFLIKPGTLLYD